MSIDLTKPIRRKYDHAPVEAIRETRHVFRILDGNSLTSYPMLVAEAELIFENIPEKRKPGEWWMVCDRVFCGKVNAENYARGLGVNPSDYVHRVIEWPDGAELPELPE